MNPSGSGDDPDPSGSSNALVLKPNSNKAKENFHSVTVLFESQQVFTLCRLLFIQGYDSKIKALLSQILFYVALHPESKKDVLQYLVQILCYHLLNKTKALEPVPTLEPSESETEVGLKLNMAIEPVRK